MHFTEFKYLLLWWLAYHRLICSSQQKLLCLFRSLKPIRGLKLQIVMPSTCLRILKDVFMHDVHHLKISERDSKICVLRTQLCAFDYTRQTKVIHHLLILNNHLGSFSMPHWALGRLSTNLHRQCSCYTWINYHESQHDFLLERSAPLGEEALKWC